MEDKKFMKFAIEDAKKNRHHFGAVIVKDNKIISKAGTRPVADARFHAETQAIFNACRKLKSKTLEDCTLYSTCEPCVMCFYMAWITKIPRVVYGATLKDSLNMGFSEIKIDDKTLNKKSGSKIKLKSGVMREECLELLKGN